MIVVDASVAAMWFLPEPQSEAAGLLLDCNDELVAPDLMRLEVSNALLKAVRRGVIDSADAVAALARLSTAAVRFERWGVDIEPAFQIAERHGGSFYDATYVVLAGALEATLATNDKELAATARSAGVQTWLISEPLPSSLRLDK